jgi:xylan 1,4-beta-xylosidase
VTRHPDGRVSVLAWAPVDVTGAEAVEGHTLRLSVPVSGHAGSAGSAGSARSVYAHRSSVSEEAGNAWAAWARMGRPASPDRRQLAALYEAAEPARSHRALPLAGGRVEVDLVLARHEVTLLELSAVRDETPPWWDDRRLLGLEPSGTGSSGTGSSGTGASGAEASGAGPSRTGSSGAGSSRAGGEAAGSGAPGETAAPAGGPQ